MKVTIKDLNLTGKKVIIRCDFNVPVKDGKITDDTRIKKSIPTINYCQKENAKIILMSHLGRVKTEEDKVKNSLNIVSKRLSELLDKEVLFIDETRGEKLEKSVSNMKDKDIILMQNTRYEDLDGKNESNCDMELAKYWAGLGDIFINDAFGTSHRAHASNFGISSYLPSGIGFLVENELNFLSYLFDAKKPFVIMLGGSKVSDKIELIKNLLPRCDKMLIGGGMAFTFLKAESYNVGNSIVDVDAVSFCREMLEKYSDKIILPVDIVCNDEFKDTKGYIKDITSLTDNDFGLDIGPKSVNIFKNYLKDAKTVMWNGPFGVYEFRNYVNGTNEILQFLTTIDAKTILGGGDIVAAASASNVSDKIYHISTGGGATLTYLEGNELIGLKNIPDRN